MITLQDIFDASYQAFIVEGKPPACNNMGNSCYLDMYDNKCAIGLLIPDGHPAQQSDATFSRLVETYPELFDSSVVSFNKYSLNKFQHRLHDGLKDGNLWPSKDVMIKAYNRVAKDYGLLVPTGANA